MGRLLTANTTSRELTCFILFPFSFHPYPYVTLRLLAFFDGLSTIHLFTPFLSPINPCPILIHSSPVRRNFAELKGKIVPVRILEARPYSLTGEMVIAEAGEYLNPGAAQ